MKARKGVEVKSYPFFNLGLDGGGWSSPRPDHFSLGKGSENALHKRLGGLWGRYKHVGETSPQLMFKLRICQPVASSHNDCDIPATFSYLPQPSLKKAFT
jgi:hypothetical protein